MFRVDNLALRSLIGNTPLYEIRPHKDGASVLIKIEGQNIGGSIKDRAAWGMLRLAEAEGKLTDDTVIVEPTSGNTGIALAMFGKALGLRVILTMPESMSSERRAVLGAYGAELVLTPAEKGMKGAIEKASEILKELNGAFMPDQFSNPGNPWAHSVTTGPEILNHLKGRNPFAFVSGIGTGGTISGSGRVLRSVFQDIKIVGLEPESSAVIKGKEAGPHSIQGIGAGFIPVNLDRGVLSSIVQVSDEDAIETTRWLAREHGLFCGISSGANVWASIEMARDLEKDNIIVTIACDRGDKYLSTKAYAQ